MRLLPQACSVDARADIGTMWRLRQCTPDNNEAVQRSSRILLRGPRSFPLPIALSALMRNASSPSGA